MSLFNPLSSSRRRLGAITAAVLVSGLLGAAKLATAQTTTARHLHDYEPVSITANSAIVPGQPLSITVELSGNPAPLTITSSPAGMVSYSGTANSSTVTVSATTSSSAMGTVTVYVKSESDTVLSTLVVAIPGDHVASPRDRVTK